MKAIKFALLIIALAIFTASCEKEPTVEYSPIFPISGEWKVQVKDASGNVLTYTNPSTGVVTSKFVIGTYNTTDNSTTQMWIRGTSTTFPAGGALRGKINVDVAAKTFSGTAIPDLAATTAQTFTITNGIVVLNGADTPSGYKADKISFTYVTSKKPGVTYLVEGYRRTMWPEDE
jgi:hypothetical protein